MSGAIPSPGALSAPRHRIRNRPANFVARHSIRDRNFRSEWRNYQHFHSQKHSHLASEFLRNSDNVRSVFFEVWWLTLRLAKKNISGRVWISQFAFRQPPIASWPRCTSAGDLQPSWHFSSAEWASEEAPRDHLGGPPSPKLTSWPNLLRLFLGCPVVSYSFRLFLVLGLNAQPERQIALSPYFRR